MWDSYIISPASYIFCYVQKAAMYCVDFDFDFDEVCTGLYTTLRYEQLFWKQKKWLATSMLWFEENVKQILNQLESLQEHSS